MKGPTIFVMPDGYRVVVTNFAGRKRRGHILRSEVIHFPGGSALGYWVEMDGQKMLEWHDRFQVRGVFPILIPN